MRPPADDDVRWVQDPDGHWHPIVQQPAASGDHVTPEHVRHWMAWAAIILVCSGIGGAIWWNWHQDQERQQRETDQFTCQLIGDC